jgi:hypothetical protein
MSASGSLFDDEAGGDSPSPQGTPRRDADDGAGPSQPPGAPHANALLCVFLV